MLVSWVAEKQLREWAEAFKFIENEKNRAKMKFMLQKKRISEEREKVQRGLTKQAEKIISLSNSKLPPVEIGSNVVVRVADVDRGQLVVQNFIAIICNINSDRIHQLGMY